LCGFVGGLQKNGFMCSSLQWNALHLKWIVECSNSRMLVPPNNKVQQQIVNLQVCFQTNMHDPTQTIEAHLQVPLELPLTYQKCHQFHYSIDFENSHREWNKFSINWNFRRCVTSTHTKNCQNWWNMIRKLMYMEWFTAW
jgi:hypothetical protein